MKRLAAFALLVALAGCTSRTEYGECLGVQDVRDPTLVYKTSIGNVVVGTIFLGTVVVPLVVLLDELVCPVGRKTVSR